MESYYPNYKLNKDGIEIRCLTCKYCDNSMDCQICTRCEEMWTPTNQFPKWRVK